MSDAPWYAKYLVDVPEGTKGDWAVERFSIDKFNAEVSNAGALFGSHGMGRTVQPGEYTRLTRGGTLVMSDTPAEVHDHKHVIHKASGHVLVAGLGLGMVTQAMLKQDRVERVTVVELSSDLIELVGSHYRNQWGDRLEIVNDDIFTWKPPGVTRYELAWFDIWDYICTDNLPEMTNLKRRFGRRVNWQGCWAQAECKRMKQRCRR